MSEFKVSYRYANSFLTEMVAANKLQTVSEDVTLVFNTLKENSELRIVLSSPVVKSEIKYSILEEIFKEKISTDTMKFINFIVNKGRENVLFKILAKFLELRNEHLGVVNADIKTALKLDGKQIEDMRKQLENYLKKNVNIRVEIDKEILGGFVARIGNTIVDASLKHQLALLKQQFLKGGYSLN